MSKFYFNNFVTTKLKMIKSDRLVYSFISIFLTISLPVSHAKDSYGFIINAYDNSISHYKLDRASGEIAWLGVTLLSDDAQDPEDVTLDSTQSYLYTANWQHNSISSYKINPVNGALTSLGSLTMTGINPWSVNISPDNKFVYVGNTANGTISEYKRNEQTGILEFIANIGTMDKKVSISPSGLKFSPDGNYLYAIDYFANSISRYKIDHTTGNLQLEKLHEVYTEVSPRAMTIANNKYAYVINEASNLISGYRINEINASLTPLTGSPYANPGIQPMGAQIDPNYNRYYVINQLSATVTIYNIDNNGELSILQSQNLYAIINGKYCNLSMPRNISFDGSSHAYINDQQGNTITAYKIEPKRGELIFINQEKTGNGAFGNLQIVK